MALKNSKRRKARKRKTTQSMSKPTKSYCHTFVFRMTEEDRAELNYVSEERTKRAHAGDGNVVSISEILRELVRREAERLRRQ
jgi:hypothetical protein